MRKNTVMSALAGAVAALLADSLLAPATAPTVVAATQPQPQIVHTATNPLIATLPVRQALGAPQGDLFASPPPPKPRRVAVAAPPAPPSPPPMPYRVAGLLEYEGQVSVVLAREDKVYTVQTGDTLEGGYRVESAEPGNVTLVYVALDVRHQLIAGSVSAPAPSPVAARSTASYAQASLR